MTREWAPLPVRILAHVLRRFGFEIITTRALQRTHRVVQVAFLAKRLVKRLEDEDAAQTTAPREARREARQSAQRALTRAIREVEDS